MLKITTLFLGLTLLLTGCTAKKPTALVSVTGGFEDVSGVMNNLSCYCGNGGYITIKNNEKIAVCFENNEKVTCTNITANGFYENKKINPGKISQCSAGEMKYLKVSSYKCN